MSEETETTRPADVAGRLDGLVGHTTITMTASHNFDAGDKIRIERLDWRWWMRFWHWVTFRPRPTVIEFGDVHSVTSNTMTLPPNAD